MGAVWGLNLPFPPRPPVGFKQNQSEIIGYLPNTLSHQQVLEQENEKEIKNSEVICKKPGQ